MPRRKTSKSFNRHKQLSQAQLAKSILRLLSDKTSKSYSIKQIKEKLAVENSVDSIQYAIDKLLDQSQLVRIGEYKYQWNRRNDLEMTSRARPKSIFTGTVDMIRSGAIYVVNSESEEDIYVPERYTKGAMNGDTVKVEVAQIRSKRRPEGKVVEILKRNLSQIIGELKIFSKYGVVTPLAQHHAPEVIVSLDELHGAKHNDKVLVEITKWSVTRHKAIFGVVRKVLQEMDENDIAMESILLSNGFSPIYPDEVIGELAYIDHQIPEAEILKRRDFRPVLTFTIDPLTAKDFDDAISFQQLENGHIEIGVHIADVTHYLREGSALDKEAFERSTSVYLVDRVCPMLPEVLSNELCSLNPSEDKLCFSAVFTFDESKKIVNQWIGKTVIHSQRRFTYEEAQERLETGEGDLAEELRIVNTIAEHLREERFKNGSINFESEELQFVLDEKNKPIGVVVRERKAAHMLVEDFMLLANKAVAIFIAKKEQPEVPYVYRVHDLPDPGKLADFALFAKGLGHQMKIDTPTSIAKSFNDLADAAKKNPALKLLEPLAIRTMAKAEYSTNNIGHYGLGFEYYTHFTSPIRRYSDVLVHRILEKNLKSTFRTDKETLEEMCKHISKQERKANDAERDSVKYKQVEFLSDKIGQEFDGVISGMIDRGIFVELSIVKAEGLIAFDDLPDQYSITPGRLKAVSPYSNKELTMGTPIRVKLLGIDLANRQISLKALSF